MFKLGIVTDLVDIGLLVGFFAFGLAIPPFVRAAYFALKFTNKHFMKI